MNIFKRIFQKKREEKRNDWVPQYASHGIHHNKKTDTQEVIEIDDLYSLEHSMSRLRDREPCYRVVARWVGTVATGYTLQEAWAGALVHAKEQHERAKEERMKPPFTIEISIPSDPMKPPFEVKPHSDR